MFLSEDYQRALDLNALGVKQAKILQLEKSDDEAEDSGELAFSLNDRAYFLIEMGENEQASKIIEEAMEYSCDTIIQCYLLLNYAKVNVELQQERQSEQAVDYQKIYKTIIAKVEEYHCGAAASNESIHLLFISHFNLGVYNQDLAEQVDLPLAADYFGKAVDIYNSREIPDIKHRYYYEQSLERLELIEGLQRAL